MEVGPVGRVQIPPGAEVIDLSRATVLPGLIDQHLYVMERTQRVPVGQRNPPLPTEELSGAQAALDAYFDWTSLRQHTKPYTGRVPTAAIKDRLLRLLRLDK